MEMIDSKGSEVASLCPKNKKCYITLKYNNHIKYDKTLLVTLCAYTITFVLHRKLH